MKKLNYDLVFVCGLIEHIGRQKFLPREDVVETLGRDELKNLLDYADVFHCQSLGDNLIELEERFQFNTGSFTTHINAQFRVPSEYQVGKVYAWLIQELFEDLVDGILQIYKSPISHLIVDYNTHVIFTPIAELVEAYKEGKLIE